MPSVWNLIGKIGHVILDESPRVFTDCNQPDAELDEIKTALTKLNLCNERSVAIKLLGKFGLRDVSAMSNSNHLSDDRFVLSGVQCSCHFASQAIDTAA